MFYYVLPGTGVYGGVKKGFHCADLLTRSGHPCIVATPDGDTPRWFPTAASVIRRTELAARCRQDDVVLFSFPPDARFVDRLPARRKIVHMMGANTWADRRLMRRPYEFIAHGVHMTQQLLRAGRIAPFVPMYVPDVFRWRGEPKVAGRVVVMSRKGSQFVNAVAAGLTPDATLSIVDGLTEDEVASTLKAADVFVAISRAEAFGLPPLEAMSAHCCVVGFPGDGGLEFMRHGDTAHVVVNGDAGGLTRAVRHVLERPAYRDALRARGAALSAYYTLEREREHLLNALSLNAS